MSYSNASRNKHQSILSSLTALGASEVPATTSPVSRNSVLASVAAAGVSLLACPSAEAGAISVFNPDVHVGYVAGDLARFKLSLASIGNGSIEFDRFQGAGFRTLNFLQSNAFGGPEGFRTSADVIAAGVYGKAFSEIGTGLAPFGAPIISATAGAVRGGSDFSQEYFAFYFLDASSGKHYGWTYGSVTGAYSNMSYHLISYAYDTTPNEKITMGQTQISSSTPEPSTAVLGAMAALILGAAGVRKWNQART